MNPMTHERALAARFEAMNKEFGSRVLVSARTAG